MEEGWLDDPLRVSTLPLSPFYCQLLEELSEKFGNWSETSDECLKLFVEPWVESSIYEDTKGLGQLRRFHRYTIPCLQSYVINFPTSTVAFNRQCSNDGQRFQKQREMSSRELRLRANIVSFW